MNNNYLYLLVFIFCTLFTYAQVTTVVDGLNAQEAANRMAIHNDQLYYSLDSEIYYFDINETIPTPVLLIDNLNNPCGLAIKDNFLYVALFWEGNIIKLDLSLPNPSPIEVTFFGQTPNMLEFKGDDLYYSDNNGNRIYRYDTTSGSSAAENFLNTTPTGPIGLAIKDNFLYFNLPTEGTILKLGLDNPQGTPIEVISGLNRPIGMAFIGDDLYIADRDDNSIVKFNITETIPTLETVVSNINLPSDVAFAGEVLYMINTDQISKIDLSLSIDEQSLNTIKLYPNPVNSYLKVANTSSDLKYHISDINGRHLQEGKLIVNGQIDTTALASGTYFITLYGETSETLKFFKQ
ncbi:T9SS type A sorting domain-containing protein [Winogradskyella sp.]|uniref:T9SS type A sorting domain-containing protein n=1 Tax=Winogradskyella sp. TaxID=1883156 RepID=UPI003BAA7A7E